MKDPNFFICRVCGGEILEPASAPVYTPSPLYACQSCAPLLVAANKSRERSSYDIQARDHAGRVAGEYLMTIGKTDVTDLTEAEWTTFLDKLFRAKQSELRRLYSPHAPPLI